MKAKTSATTLEITHAAVSDPNPIHFRDARTKAGVYRLQKWAGSAAIVVMGNDKIFFVNDSVVDDNAWQEYADRIVWKTAMEPPDEITKP